MSAKSQTVVNTDGASTNTSAAGASADVKKSAQGTSPGAKDGFGSLADVVQKAYQKAQTESSNSDDSPSDQPDIVGDADKVLVGSDKDSLDNQDPKDTEDQNENDAADVQTEGSAEVDENSEEDENEESEESEASEETEEEGENKTVPYKRFTEALQSKKQLEEKLKEAGPLVTAQQNLVRFCEDNELDANDFKTAMHLAAALKNDPDKARQMLSPIIEALGLNIDDDAFPEDIQKMVDEGLSVEVARRLAKAERGQQAAKVSAQRLAQQQQARAQRQVLADMQTSVSNWARAKQAQDPRFKPSTNGLDGMYEFFTAKYMQEFVNITDPREAVALAERVYDRVSKAFNAHKPVVGKKSAPVIKSDSGRSGKAPNGKQEGSLLAVTTAVARKHGLNV